MTLLEKVAYLKGLAEGMELEPENSKEFKLISVMIGLLEEMAAEIEDLQDDVDDLAEELEELEDDVDEVFEALDVISDDLGEVEEELFDLDDLDFDDEDWDEDDEDDCGCGCGHHHHHGDEEDDFFTVAECPNCGEDIFIDAAALEEGYIQCANCEEKFGIDIDGGHEHEHGGCGCGHCHEDAGEDADAAGEAE